MTNACRVCGHPRRAEIERDLIALVPVMRVAKRFGLAERSVGRHKETHLFAALARSEKARDALRLERLLERVAYLDTKVNAAFVDAEKTKDPGLTLKAVREGRGNLELLGKLLGELQEGATVNITLATSQEWQDLKTRIIAALEPHPIARAAVLEALKEGER